MQVQVEYPTCLTFLVLTLEMWTIWMLQTSDEIEAVSIIITSKVPP